MHSEELYKDIMVHVRYDNGKLYWNSDHYKYECNNGKEVGRVSSQGYMVLRYRVNGKRLSIPVHRLIYFMFHGVLSNTLDHINRDKLDNRIDNLRAVTLSQNGLNRAPKYKYKGVYLINGRYKATSGAGAGTTIYLGTYDTDVEAAKAYNDYIISLGLQEYAWMNPV